MIRLAKFPVYFATEHGNGKHHSELSARTCWIAKFVPSLPECLSGSAESVTSFRFD